MTELERILGEVGDRLDHPATTHLPAAVRARLVGAPTRSPWRAQLTGRRLRVAVLALVLFLSATLTLWSPARRAVADLLGLGGVRITRQDPPAPPAEGGLPLGEGVSADELGDLATFPVRLPALAHLGEPDQRYFDREVPGGLVSLVYRPDSRLPDAGDSGIGLLISQFRGRLESPVLTKFAGDSRVMVVEVLGRPAYWIAGPGHPVLRHGPSGRPRDDALFRAANVLLWEVDGVTRRLESVLPLEAALEIARSMG